MHLAWYCCRLFFIEFVTAYYADIWQPTGRERLLTLDAVLCKRLVPSRWVVAVGFVVRFFSINSVGADDGDVLRCDIWGFHNVLEQ